MYEMQSFKNMIWKKKGLIITIRIFTFIRKMLANLHSYQFRKLTHQNFKALNDQSAYYRFYANKNYVNSNLTYMDKIRYWFNANNFLNKIKTTYKYTLFSHTINPNNSFKLIFDFILSIMLVINVAYLPMNMSFNIEWPEAEILLLMLPDYLFLIHIILQFNTAYYDSGVLRSQRKEIAKHYLKNSCILDCLSMVPLIFNFDQSYFMNFFILLRLNALVDILLFFEENYNMRKNYGTYIDVIKLMSIFLYSSHIFACLFFLIAKTEISDGVQDTWIQINHIQDAPWQQQYVTAMYWGSVTTLTIGYGDILPTTNIERAYVILVALLSSIVFGFTISNIGQIFNNITEQKKTQRHRMSMITSFIQKRGLNKELEIRVRKFFEYYFQIEENRDQECEVLMQQLTEDLRKEVKIDFYKRYLMKQPLIFKTFSEEFINKICLIMHERLLIPEERFLFKGDQVNDLSFIIEGYADIIIEFNKNKQNKLSQIRRLNQSQSIAMNYFFTQSPIPYTIKSKTFTRIVQINLQELQQLLLSYPKDWEKFKKLQQSIRLNECPLIECDICKQTHQLEKCNVLFYTPNSKQIIKKIYSIKQDRSNFIRENRIQYQTFNDKLSIQEGVLSFAIDENYFQKESINEEFVQKYDFVRLRNAELNMENRSIKIAQSSKEEPKIIKRRNGVRASIRQVIAESNESSDSDSQNLIQMFKILSYRSSEQIEFKNYPDQILYNEYLNIIKPDVVSYLDKQKEFEHFNPQDNITNVLQRNIEVNKNYFKLKTKKSRRLIKKSTWLDSVKPKKVQF
ncbi:unnamed protein product [Paramecium primaurelia]|uniref:Cyclic nucleotide-binding domain-containing protein n=1 Tax=Paramecium primaurelia TaxID=5886 RepID=A0A8S1K905_PARPR|nr:unnamed protein product [Paramecium primaurelia]